MPSRPTGGPRRLGGASLALWRSTRSGPTPHTNDAVVGARYGGSLNLAVDPNGDQSCCPSWHTFLESDVTLTYGQPARADWSIDPITPGSFWNIHWLNS